MKARVIAYYLPQFHPIPENDAVWGKGFTEWTNVAKAKPLFKGHHQPRIPADLGFYDLRLPEVREQQAEMARNAGIEGFCYWHYWFGNGKRLLQRPFEEVLATGKPDFPFCLAWANHDWTTRTWENVNQSKMIAKQTYPGDDDYIIHFQTVLPAFKDHRYITVDGKPLFCIYDPYHFRDVSHFIELWRKLANENELKGIHFVAMCNSTSTVKRNEDGSLVRVQPNLKSSEQVYKDILNLGFNAINPNGKSRSEMLYSGKYNRIAQVLAKKYIHSLPVTCFDYPKLMKLYYSPEDSWENIYPNILPQWDRTPRSGKDGDVYVNATPENFKKHILHALSLIQNKEKEHKILFLRSWNEWAEGNYVEPDMLYGTGFLDALAETIK